MDEGVFFHWFDGRGRFLVSGFFILLVLLGLGVFKDYGISWDDGNNRHYGRIVLRHVFGDFAVLETPTSTFSEPGHEDSIHCIHGRNHGPAVEVVFAGLERVLSLKDTREIFLLRHILNYLVFCLGVFFFHLLVTRIFGDWRMGLLGSMFLVASPRIFAHSFHNSIDVPFMSMFIVCLYTLSRFVEVKGLYWASIHAIACGILIDIRSVGVMLPFLTLGFMAFEVLTRPGWGSAAKRLGLPLAVYIIQLCCVVVLLWPTLWESPIAYFAGSLLEQSSYSWPWWEIYMGEKVYGRQAPWHFTPVWMAVTTPPLYLAFFFIGLSRLFLGWRKIYPQRRIEFAALLSFILPLAAVAIRNSTLFNGWRHFFFIYPGFLIICLGGVQSVFRFFKGRWRPGVWILLALIASSMACNIYFMAESHPIQNTYFNFLAGGMRQARRNFAVGYWGAEFKPAYEYILENDNSSQIVIAAYPPKPAEMNLAILRPRDRERLRLTNYPLQADYFIGNYHQHPNEYRHGEDFYSIRVDGAKLVVVKKM